MAKPRIKIPDFETEVRQFMTEFKNEFGQLKKTFSNYNTLVVGILAIGFVVLLFSLGAILLQALQINNERNQTNVQSEIIRNNVENQKTVDDRLKGIEEYIKSNKTGK